MPIEYTYDEEKNVLYTRFYGVITDADLKAQGEAVTSDPRVMPGVRELVDLSGVEGEDVTSDGLAKNIQIDTMHREKLTGMKTAIVAATDLQYGLSRMYQALAEVQKSPAVIEVFREEKAAREWLGLEDEEA